MSKPKPSDLARLCPEVEVELIKEHVDRLDDRYFDQFDPDEICRHLRALAPLSTKAPVEVLLDRRKAGRAECTVLAFDYPFEFSLITGLLGAAGFDILSGSVFTYRPVRRQETLRTGRPPHRNSPRRRRIIDHFLGSIPEAGFDISEIRKKLGNLFILLESGKSDQAKRMVNELVAESLSELKIDSRSALYPMQIETDNSAERYTRIQVLTEDTPFFLFAFSTALSLRGISIEQVTIHTEQKRVEDIFDLADVRGRGKLKEAILNEVRLSLMLTKQFTYFLGQAPDPFAALTRFEAMSEEILSLPEKGKWLDLIANPQIMRDLARLLGASDFIWEDFIRLNYENLLPMLAPHTEGRSFRSSLDTLDKRFADVLSRPGTMEERVKRLNRFKDNEIYLIDLEHILDPNLDFTYLAERLTVLADRVINAAFEITFQPLSEQFGRPLTVAGLEAQHAVCGLGKLGGQALGYASDIEVLFIYSDNGRTEGGSTGRSISNAEFFEQLVKKAVASIRAKKEGFFMLTFDCGPTGPMAR